MNLNSHPQLVSFLKSVAVGISTELLAYLATPNAIQTVTIAIIATIVLRVGLTALIAFLTTGSNENA